MKQVLVVDDNRTNAKIIQILAAGQPCEIDISLTPEEGLSRLASKSYDIALVDVYMPGMSGVEMIKKFEEIRDPSYRPRIVFITADMNFNPTKEGLESIGAQVVRKPFKAEELLSALRG